MLRPLIFLTLLIFTGNSNKIERDEDNECSLIFNEDHNVQDKLNNEPAEGKKVGQFKNIKISDIPSDTSLPDRKIDYNYIDDIKHDNKMIRGQIESRSNEPENVLDSWRILPGIIKNPTSEELDYNKLIQNKTQFRRKDSDSEQIFTDNIKGEIKNDDGNDNVLVDKTPEIEKSSLNLSFPTKENSIENQLFEPTRGGGILNMKNTKVMLLENSRICYACSTMSDPTCWSPDSRTTAKYCHKGHNSCLTKSFHYKGTSFIVRDCGSYCGNPNDSKYSKCSICDKDLCNSASNTRTITSGIALIVMFSSLLNRRLNNMFI